VEIKKKFKTTTKRKEWGGKKGRDKKNFDSLPGPPAPKEKARIVFPPVKSPKLACNWLYWRWGIQAPVGKGGGGGVGVKKLFVWKEGKKPGGGLEINKPGQGCHEGIRSVPFPPLSYVGTKKRELKGGLQGERKWKRILLVGGCSQKVPGKKETGKDWGG